MMSKPSLIAAELDFCFCNWPIFKGKKWQKNFQPNPLEDSQEL